MTFSEARDHPVGLRSARDHPEHGDRLPLQPTRQPDPTGKRRLLVKVSEVGYDAPILGLDEVFNKDIGVSSPLARPMWRVWLGSGPGVEPTYGWA